MKVTIYFYLFGVDEEKIYNWMFFNNEMDISFLTECCAKVYKYKHTAIIKKIEIERV